jgi:uncharacterized coiled-coil DUF342 family protein
MDIDPRATMGLGAFAGLIIGKFADFIIRKQVQRDDEIFKEAESIRKELREEVRSLREKIDKQDAEINTWRERYFDLSTKYQDLLAEFHSLKRHVESNNS